MKKKLSTPEIYEALKPDNPILSELLKLKLVVQFLNNLNYSLKKHKRKMEIKIIFTEDKGQIIVDNNLLIEVPASGTSMVVSQDDAGYDAFLDVLVDAMEKKDDITIQSEHPL